MLSILSRYHHVPSRTIPGVYRKIQLGLNFTNNSRVPGRSGNARLMRILSVSTHSRWFIACLLGEIGQLSISNIPFKYWQFRNGPMTIGKCCHWTRLGFGNLGMDRWQLANAVTEHDSDLQKMTTMTCWLIHQLSTPSSWNTNRNSSIHFRTRWIWLKSADYDWNLLTTNRICWLWIESADYK